MMFEPLTEREKKTFDTLVEATNQRFSNANVALMRVQFDGEDAAAVVIMTSGTPRRSR